MAQRDAKKGNLDHTTMTDRWKTLVFTFVGYATAIACLGLPSPAHAYQFFTGFSHWNPSSTASLSDSGSAVPGNPVILTWSIVPDGTDIPEAYGEPVANSSVISFMDTDFGNSGATLADRPWFHIYNDSYERWEEVSGLTISYEPNDNGVASPGSGGVIGTRGDMRVGGHSIDGQFGALAYNYAPDSGDMVVDTADGPTFTTAANDYRLMRNTLMHEIGHGLGINHLDSFNSSQLMEPFVDTSFDGPQHDDIRSVQRQYGDKYERGAGNDTAASATSLGSLIAGSTFTIGSDADNATVARANVDFISIDDDTDSDFLSFSLPSQLTVSLTLTPLGRTYYEGPEGGPEVAVNTAQLSDLTLMLYDTNGTSILGTSNLAGIGGAESLNGYVLNAGTYYSRVTGTADTLQFYQLSITAVPEPGTLALLGAALAGLGVLRRRRRQTASAVV